MEHAYAGRRSALQELLAARELDGLLVTALSNVRYLSGFSGSAGALLVPAAGETRLASDGRYQEQARREAPDLEFVLTRDQAGALLGRARTDGLRRLGFEEHAMSVGDWRDLDPGPAELIAAGRPVESLRVGKEDTEIALLEQACELTDTALDDLRHRVRVGATERSLAGWLEARFRELGADGAAFDTIVAAGSNAAVPHHRPGSRPLAPGDLLTVDCGARVGGYCADTTRTWIVGAEPADWQREIHALVARAQQAGIEAAVPGARFDRVDAAARDLVEHAGHGAHFGHGLGHGVGLDIHEAPLLAATSEGRLGDRVPVTVEPGVYLPGRGGVRIEDVVLVRPGPGPRRLTRTTRELVRVG